MIVANRGKAPLERELVIARTLDASREMVFAAWTDPRHAAFQSDKERDGHRWGWNSAFDRLDGRSHSL